MSEKYLVLGGGGFLGHALVKRLLRAGCIVRSFSRRNYPELEAMGVECVQGDILDHASLERACTGCDTVFHTIAICDIVKGWKAYYDVNVQGTQNVIDSCRKCGVKRLVYTSSPSVVIGQQDIVMGTEELPYAKRYLSPYPATKAMAEQMVLKADSPEMRTCALRPHLMWGVGEPHIIPNLLKMADAGRLAIVGDGMNRVSITNVENAAEAHYLAAMELAATARCAGKPYFVNDMEPVLLWDWINRLLEGTGRPKITRHISRRMLYFMGWLNELMHHLPGTGVPKLTRFVANQLGRSHCFSCERAEIDFCYKPVVSPEEGIQLMLASLNSVPKGKE
ncbi:MAG: NAD-dependent epimerase/dehydratase family protein [Victivallales bacterium]|nr:NAD-dependent epimerase/dehydratase family protein [Victivallales bacterium]